MWTLQAAANLPSKNPKQTQFKEKKPTNAYIYQHFFNLQSKWKQANKQKHLQKSVALTQTDCKQWNINFILQACTHEVPSALRGTQRLLMNNVAKMHMFLHLTPFILILFFHHIFGQIHTVSCRALQPFHKWNTP